MSSSLSGCFEQDRGAVAEDRITLTGLEVFAYHGVFLHEREQGQRFLVDAEVALDLGATNDALERTLHYGELAESIYAAVAADPVDLIETVAERVAGVVLAFEGVQAVRITVHKPDAPIEVTFADVSVTVTRYAAADTESVQLPHHPPQTPGARA